jgi:hypothetical protein
VLVKSERRSTDHTPLHTLTCVPASARCSAGRFTKYTLVTADTSLPFILTPALPGEPIAPAPAFLHLPAPAAAFLSLIPAVSSRVCHARYLSCMG